MAKIPQGAAVAIGKHPIPSGASVKADVSERIDPLDGEAAPEADSLDVLKPKTATGAAARGLAQGVTLGFGDEAMAAVDTGLEANKRAQQWASNTSPMRDAVPAVNPTSPHVSKSWEGNNSQSTADFLKEQDRIIPEQPAEEAPQESLRTIYRRARFGYGKDDEASKAAHPTLYGGAKLLGNVAVPIPGGAATGVVGKVGQGIAQGTKFGLAQGAGESKADLLSGDAREAAGFVGDTLTSGALGAAGGAVGGLIGAGASRLAGRFAGKAKAADAAALAARTEEKSASALGDYRKKLGEDIRQLERYEAQAKNPRLDRDLRDAADEWLSSPEGLAKAKRAAEALLEQTPGRGAELEAAHQAFLGAPSAAASEHAAEMAKNTLTEDVLPRALHYAKPAIASAVGGVAAGPFGAGAGALIGAASGKPGRAIANLTQKTPRFTIQANELAAAGSEGLGALAEDVAPALAAGETTEVREAIADPDDEPRNETRRDGKKSPTVKKSWGKLGDRFNR